MKQSVVDAAIQDIGRYEGIDLNAISDPTADKSRRFDAIARLYARDRARILQLHAERRGTRLHGFIDWRAAMTPIERQFYDAALCYPLALYPQYPVGRRFVDFGNPYHRVAVELDSVAWHDPVADHERDVELLGLGWETYRVPSRFLHEPEEAPDTTDLDADAACRVRQEWMSRSPEGLLKTLSIYYVPTTGDDPPSDPEEHELAESQRRMAAAVLDVWRGRGTKAANA